MYGALRNCDRSLTHHGGPLSALYKRLWLMRLFQWLSMPGLLLFGFIAVDQTTIIPPTDLGLVCILLMAVIVSLNVTFEFKTLATIESIRIIRELISPEESLGEFVLWFKYEKQLCAAVSQHVQSIRDSGQDPAFLLRARVHRAMLLLTGHRATVWGARVEGNTDPTPAAS
jgi:hypothetical protein